MRAPVDGYVHPGFGAVADRFRATFEGDRAGGGAMCVTWRGRTVVDLWAGHRDAAHRVPWTPDTLSLCFSTTKGVAVLVLHRLADRGLLDYDQPVATYWPAFAQAGKEHITVRQAISHQAGLHNVRDLVDSPLVVLDSEEMERRVAAAAPDPAPGTGAGYHGFTFGWIVAGITRAVTGKDMATLFREELAGPLGRDDLHLGAGTPEVRDRVADLLVGDLRRLYGAATFAGRHVRPLRRSVEALYTRGFHHLLRDPRRPLLDGQFPAANGVFSARSLAALYGALANGGTVDGTTLLSPATATAIGRVQHRGRDYVTRIPMRWRLGYHQGFVRGRQRPMAFGHYGFGGSGGWADPASGLALAFTTNRLMSATTPIADGRILALGAAVLQSAERVGAPPTRTDRPAGATGDHDVRHG